MNVLIVAATQFEIKPFLEEKKSVDILISGVGIAPVVFYLTKKIFENKYDFIIQAGIAGSFTDRFNLGETVMVKEDTFADVGIEENGKIQTLFETGFMDKNEFPYTNGWLINKRDLLQKNILPVVKGITVNKVTGDDLQNKINEEKFSAAVESMEGAAFHYVCLQQKINFLQLRSISNKVGERDKAQWKIKEAIENLNTELIKIIDNL